MAGVFLSYRRNDSGGWAGRLRDHLALRYGKDRVWQDVDDLTVGADYLPQILQNIAAADAVYRGGPESARVDHRRTGRLRRIIPTRNAIAKRSAASSKYESAVL